MNRGIELIYQPVASPSDWYAPATLVACVGVLAATEVLRRIAAAGYRAGKRVRLVEVRAGARPEFEAEQMDRAQAYPGVHRTAVLLGYSLLLSLVCAVAMFRLGRMGSGQHGSALLVNTAPGLPVAVAMLFPLSVFVMTASLVVLLLASHAGEAVVGTGLLAAMWSFALAPVAAAAGLLALLAKIPYAGPGLFGAAGVLLVAGLWLRFGRLIGGKSAGELAREAAQRARRQHVQAERAEAQPRGEYERETPRVRRRRNEIDIQTRPVVRWLRWDESGLDVEWMDWAKKAPRRFAWGELTSLKQTQFLAPGISGVLVRTASRERLLIPDGGEGWSALTTALEVHIWGRE